LGSVLAAASDPRRYDSALSLLFERYESLLGRVSEPIRAYESLVGRMFEQYRGYEATIGTVFEEKRKAHESLGRRAFEQRRRYESSLGRVFEQYRGYESSLGRAFDQYESRLGSVFEQSGGGYGSALRIVEQISWDIYGDTDTEWPEDDGAPWWIGQLPAIVQLRLLLTVLALLELSSQKQADFTGEGLPPDIHSAIQILIGLAATILVFMEAKAKLAGEAGAAGRAESARALSPADGEAHAIGRSDRA
jgi:hypothetical protein